MAGTGRHGFGHGVPGEIGVEGAGEAVALGQHRGEPGGVGSGAGGREAKVIGIESGATDRVEGRFVEDGLWSVYGRRRCSIR